MSEVKKKYSACHNAVVFDKAGVQSCGVCEKACDLADPKEAEAAIKASGRTPEMILAGRAPNGRKGAPAPAPKASEDEESSDEDESEDEDSGEAQPVKVAESMKRDDLVKVARDEGANDEEIEACDKKADLVALIEKRRDNEE